MEHGRALARSAVVSGRNAESRVTLRHQQQHAEVNLCSRGGAPGADRDTERQFYIILYQYVRECIYIGVTGVNSTFTDVDHAI